MCGEWGAYSAEYVSYGVQRRDVAHWGTNLQTFRMKYVATSSLAEK